MSNKTVADVIFDTKDKIVSKTEQINIKTANVQKSLNGGFKKLSTNANDIKSKLDDKSYDVSKKASAELQQFGNNAKTIGINVKNTILRKLGFDKYQKQYEYSAMSAENFVKRETINEDKRELFEGIAGKLQLTDDNTPYQSNVLRQYLNGEIEQPYIKNAYNIAYLSDKVLNTQKDIGMSITKDKILDIEYADKKVDLYVNNVIKKDCLEVSKEIGPEQKSTQLDDVIAKNSVRQEGEPVPKTPMELLMEMMQQMNPGSNS